MRTIWLLWRLSRVLEKARADLRGASINVVAELPDASTYRAACTEADMLGLPKPERRVGWEVTIWPDRYVAANGAATKRGATLADALRLALDAL